MTTRFAARFITGYLLAMTCVAAGCNSEKPTGTVTGTVTYHNDPVTAGSVNLLSTTGAAAQIPLDETGSFKLDTPIESGDYKVYILPPVPGQYPPGTKPPPTPKFTLPTKFRDPGASGVTITINPGPNTIPIRLID